MSSNPLRRVLKVPSSVVTLVLIAFVIAAAVRRPYAEPERGVPSASTLDEALAIARARGLWVALDFTSDDAPASEALRGETWCDPLVHSELEANFVHVELDAVRDAATFERIFERNGRLASCVLDADGEIVAEHAGFADAASYATLLERARGGSERLARARELAALATGDATALEALATAREACGDSRRAELAFRELLGAPHATRPMLAVAHERLARFAVERGDDLAARSELELARSTQVSSLETRELVTEALALELERDPRGAQSLLERAVARELDPAERESALLALGRVRRDAGDDRAALETFARLIDERPTETTLAAARQSIAAIRDGAYTHTH